MDYFHPAVSHWFTKTFKKPTQPQSEAWPAIKQQLPVLIAAPTGSGKTLAAFLAVIDDLVHLGLQQQGLVDQTYILYVSPLKALSNDIQKNLQEPLEGIARTLEEMDLMALNIRCWVRTGDTPAGERTKMRKKPPHIIVTTPESLFILLTSDSGRDMLKTVGTVIIDEIHALAANKRGSHLALSLERLEALTAGELLRIGLSATQKPIDVVANFLMGNNRQSCQIIDSGYSRKRDLSIVMPLSPLEAIMSNEVWEELYAQLTEFIENHRTTLIFVNTRRLAERAARFLAEKIGEEFVTAHHGSLAKEHRLEAEQKLKRGELKAMVATASLELGIDIGDIDLVCQIGCTRSIAAFLQRVGRSGHTVGGLPKGRLFPLSRDNLVECVALLDAVEQGQLDRLHIPIAPLDVLAQQLIGEVACREWQEQELFQWVQRSYPYRNFSFNDFKKILSMLADGFSTRRGRRSQYIHWDQVNNNIRARKGAKLTAVTNAGTIPDQFDYDVILEPQGQFIGNLNEDFAFESLPGDIFQLGNTSYRILKIEQGKVRVEDAQGQPPNIPFWFGEAPGRTDEMSDAVSLLREQLDAKLDEGIPQTINWLMAEKGLAAMVAEQLVEYLATARAALRVIPSKKELVFERFFDEAGDQHLVIHSPHGSRLNRAWGLALRKTFCRHFNFELQATALEDTIVLSLGATHSFALEEASRYLKSATVRDILTQALLDVPLFLTHWRWNASIAFALQRNRQGKRVPAQFQRMDAEDLVAVVFPDQLACLENIVGNREIPDHPLIQQTLDDCLTDVMDIKGLENLLRQLENNEITIHCRDLAGPSPLAQEILGARPYAFLDDAPAEERRTQAVMARRFVDPESAAELGRLNPEAIQAVKSEAWPIASNGDEYHDALLMLGFVLEDEAKQFWPACDSWFETLMMNKRACRCLYQDRVFQVAAERLVLFQNLFDMVSLQPEIHAVGNYMEKEWSAEECLREILRGRLQGLGPVTENALAASLVVGLTEIQIALYALENEGFAMRGEYSPDAGNGEGDTEWCERGLLARIHRYTLKQLRHEIQPVTAAQYMCFLFRWHHLDEKLENNEAALLNVLNQLEGFPLPAASWEAEVLPARIKTYFSSYLDNLCVAGQITWMRARKNNVDSFKQGPVKNTPLLLMSRNAQLLWRSLAPGAEQELMLSSNAQKVCDSLQNMGASFFNDLLHYSGLLRSHLELALGELVSAGLATSDAFAGLRELIKPSSKKNKQRKRRYTYMQAFGHPMDNAGRWSLLPVVSKEQKPSANWFKTDKDILEHVAKVLLRRYGVVFRKVLEREINLPPWRELLYVYRRLEARGEIRGGRFVDGFGGEQFALPEAVGLIRKMKKNNKDENMLVVNGVDPVNLTGNITLGKKVAALPANRILFKAGVPVAVINGGEVEWLQDLSEDEQWVVKNLLVRGRESVSYLSGQRGLLQ